MPTIKFGDPDYWRLSHDMRWALEKLVKLKPEDTLLVPDHRKRQTHDALVRRGYAESVGNQCYKATDAGRALIERENKAQGWASTVMRAVRENEQERRQ